MTKIRLCGIITYVIKREQTERSLTMENMNVIETYLNTLNSKNTKVTYNRAILDMFEYLNNKNVQDITNIDLQNYRSYLFDKFSDNTVQTKLRAVDSFFKFLFENYMIKVNPSVGRDGKPLSLKKRIEKVRTKTYIPMEQSVKLIDYGKNSRDRAIIAVYLTTGVRVSELINLTLEDYQNKHAVIMTKGRKARDIFFNETACKYIDEYLKDRIESEYNNLFISNTHKPMNPQALNRTLKVIAKRAGLPTDITNHQLRHTCISYIVKQSDLETARQFIGHSTTAMTSKYTHSTNKEVVNLSNAILF